ncbi:MAG: hypothetical protein HY664_04350 [Chloroflexi bacterium]|nr:hypothetical protein [Chloroflexota bacterium]
MTEPEIVHFLQPGPKNTEEVLRLAKKRAEELGIRSIIVATTRGRTGASAAEFFPGYRVIVVSHSSGFHHPDEQELTEEYRTAIESQGGVILTTTHALGGVGRAVRRKLGTYQMEELVAYTLRILGQGMKVVCEIAVMAADAGLVRTDEDAIVIAGTGRGADTAVVLRPVNAQDFFDLRIKEILCRPRLRSAAEAKAAASLAAQA